MAEVLIHLDTAACGRMRPSTIGAVAEHCRVEAEQGGYFAADAVSDRLAALRAELRTLSGISGGEVRFSESATAAFSAFVALRVTPAWRVGVLATEWGSNLTALADTGVEIEILRTDSAGLLEPDWLELRLRRGGIDAVLIDAEPAYRGVRQPVAALVAVCRECEVELWVDGSQSFGHWDCASEATVAFGTSRKWLGGPRGLGFVVAAPGVFDGSARGWNPLAEGREVAVALQVGLHQAVGDVASVGIAEQQRRLDQVGMAVRDRCADLQRWTLEEPNRPGAIVLLSPREATDLGVVRRRTWEQGVICSVTVPSRTPNDPTHPMIRLSPDGEVTPPQIHEAIAILDACGAPGR